MGKKGKEGTGEVEKRVNKYPQRKAITKVVKSDPIIRGRTERCRQKTALMCYKK